MFVYEPVQIFFLSYVGFNDGAGGNRERSWNLLIEIGTI